ncbi:MAG: peptide-methionine (S)-S-oxide reductase MsrA [Nannocystis sp.]|nr:peptide-methionine (S)-S-oxide reductase MsrA [Nannocystis sp.]
MLRRDLLAAAMGALICGCGSAEQAQRRTAPEPELAGAAAPAPATRPSGQIALGYFAGGCFWGVEHFLEALPGVIDVDSGYMGGEMDAPSYEAVSSGATGHAETVRVRFDPAQISYEAVARRFFEIHDPTEVDRQGPDIGDQYRSAVFVQGPEERRVVEGLIAALKANGYAVATTIHEAASFWPAEGYHQDYYARTGKQPYCHRPVPRFDERAE